MIKIEKDFSDVPASLKSDKTKQKLEELCATGKYIDTSKFNDVYKADDVKQKLENIYHNKCVYCETISSSHHIEHFRHKSHYYWLAYSWDNLLLACSGCNQNKGSKFDLVDENKRIKSHPDDLSNQHNLSIKYNKLENPLFINPKYENPELLIKFSKNGEITSTDKRMKYTIKNAN